MDSNPNDLIARILAENEKINLLNDTLNAARLALTDGDNQLRIYKEKLDLDEFSESLLCADAAVEYYERLVSSSQLVQDAENSSPDVEQLKKEALDLLHQGQSLLTKAKQAQFVANDLNGLQTDIESEIAAENWVLVDHYAVDALNSYSMSNAFKRYAELAKQKSHQEQFNKQPRFGLPFRRKP